MGGTPFIVTAEGPDAESAFRAVTDQARHDNGHGGYTGTIADKHSLAMFAVPDGVDVEPRRLASWILSAGDDPTDDEWAFVPAAAREPLLRIMEAAEDKWGACCGFAAGEGRFVFFGWASS